MLLKRSLSLLLSVAWVSATVEGPPKSFVPLHPQSIIDPFKSGQSRVQAQAQEFDYVVVGSGAGGGPVAARLALNGFRVLILEAGDDQGNNLNTSVVAFHPYSTEDPKLAWSYYVRHYQDTERQKRDSKSVYDTPSGGLYVGLHPPPGSRFKGILYPRSSTIGGCAEHNALITVYPHRSDWENLERITGDPSWNPDIMRQYFERLEDCIYCGPLGAPGHGKTGWLGVDRADVTLALPDAKLLAMIVSTAVALGEGIVGKITGSLVNLLSILAGDINSANPARDFKQGYYQIPLHSRNNQRSSPRDFVVNVANAQNPDGSKKYQLYVQLNTFVTKIQLSSDPKPRATGVEYLVGQSLYKASPRYNPQNRGTPGQVSAVREVIVAGGVYETPHLLKLSGIGPRQELSRFGIPVRVDLPGVGGNLQDHYEISVIDQTGYDFEVDADCTFGRTNPDPCLVQWETTRLGPYQSNGFFLSTIQRTSQAGINPDILMFGGVAVFRGYFPGYAEEAFTKRNWTWTALRAHTPNHGGTVQLASADPTDVPIINFNYFDTSPGGVGEADAIALMEMIKFARTTFPKPPLSPDTFTEIIPGYDKDTDAKILQWVKDESWGHHASCTAPIGADNDPYAVLDTNFRVRGVDGLRVVDASIFPRIPGYFLVLPTFIIAEKAADVITQAAYGL